MKITLNKNKNIGEVLFVVEGAKTEFYILNKIFEKIFDYQYETIKRSQNFEYKCYNPKDNPNARVFVINTEESNIKYIKKDNEFLNQLFFKLLEDYAFDVDNAAIYYLFDRDDESNTDAALIQDLMNRLVNAYDNPDAEDGHGMLLLSYPAVESFTLSNFRTNTFQLQFSTKESDGVKIKNYLHSEKINQSNMTENTLIHAINELFLSLDIINGCKYELDNFGKCNRDVFTYEEAQKQKTNLYNALSLIGIALLDLGLIEITKDT